MQRRDAAWAALGIESGFGAVDDAASPLWRFASVADQTRVGPPAAWVVLTGAGLAHRRPDGVTEVPVVCLR
ncbi:MAG: hypothetical protein LBE08_06425 [Bifidobacteriaceae bacterium]|nr:hypothetical protein [Bifidobacteriaceae bacterium]